MKLHLTTRLKRDSHRPKVGPTLCRELIFFLQIRKRYDLRLKRKVESVGKFFFCKFAITKLNTYELGDSQPRAFSAGPLDQFKHEIQKGAYVR